MGLVNADENRELCPCGEVIALGSQKQSADVAVGRLVDGGAQVGEQLRAVEVLRRAVDHDLAEVIGSLEARKGHR
ncbi:MAG TPA: hypothetical protein VF921_17810 [Vicinamibacterales bacterium]